MKAFNTIAKILTALAAVAGAVYVVATYGDKIVAWAKEIWAKMPQCPCSQDAEPVEEIVEEPAAEEAPAEEAAPVEDAVEEPAVEVADEVVVAENEPVAEDADFAE